VNPKQTKIVAFGACVMLALLAATWFFGVSPQMKKASEHKAAAEAAVQTTTTLQSTLTSLQQKQGDLDKASGQYRQLARQFPEDFDGTAWVTMVSNAAVRTGVSLDTVTPAIPTVSTPGAAPTDPNAAPAAVPVPGAAVVPADPSAMLASSAVTLNVTGSSPAIRAFVKAIGLLDRPVLVTSVNISTAEQGSTAEISGTTYLMRTLPEPGSAEAQDQAAAEAAAGDAAVTETPVP
jgi:Tfp pilus assembly protein PilO